MAALSDDVLKYPDDYQYERAQRFNVSTSAIACTLKRLGVSHKRTLKHPKANESLRITFKQKIKDYRGQGTSVSWYSPIPE